MYVIKSQPFIQWCTCFTGPSYYFIILVYHELLFKMAMNFCIQGNNVACHDTLDKKRYIIIVCRVAALGPGPE